MDLKRLLVFRVGHLGDTLVALPAFWALRKSFPDTEITYLTNYDAKNPHYLSARNVLPAHGLFDRWISYPNLSGGFSDGLRLLRLAAELRRGNFDAVLYLMTRNRTPSQIVRDKKFFRLAGIKNILGADYLEKHSLGLQIPQPVPRIERESDFLLSLISSEDLVRLNIPLTTDLSISAEENERADAWLESKNISKDSRLMAVAPGSKWDSKIWDEARFSAVVDRLIATHDVIPVILGGAEDREKGDRLIAGWGRGVNAAGELKVRESASALERCEIYLGNDTGTMHLAAAVGTRCVAIFAAIDWDGRWEPFGDGHAIFRRRVECEGCHSPTCFNHHKCLDLISAEEVYEACAAMLSTRPSANVVSIQS